MTTTIPTVALGDTLNVSALGFGAMALAGVYGEISQQDALATLNHSIDAGVTFIDTADIYGAGDNEKLIAKLLKQRRSEVTLATKFGIKGSVAENTLRSHNDPAYAREAVDASLARLDTDVIDLYYLHRREVSVPIEDIVGAMAELVRAGKVRHLGLSEVTADELVAAQAVHPIAAVQSEWSIWSRDVEREVVPTAARLGIGFVPYSPLGRGFLTGTLTDAASFSSDDLRATMTRFSGDAFAKNQAIVAAVTDIANSYGATPAQIALAWLYSAGRKYGLPVVPIPGTRRPSRVDENVGSVNITLTATDKARLDDLSAEVIGARSIMDDPNWVSDTR